MRRSLAVLCLLAGVCILGTLGSVRGDEKKKVSDAEIRKQLSSPTQILFEEAPLADVAGYLTDYHGVPVVIDKESIHEENGDEEPSVTFWACGISLRSGLNLLVRDLGLGWCIHNSQLVITTPEAVRRRLGTAAYDVTDLVNGDGKGTVALEALLTKLIAPDSWAPREKEAAEESSGDTPRIERGNGTLTVEKASGRILFSIVQTEPVHWQIERMLRELRALVAGKLSWANGAVQRPTIGVRAALESPTKIEFQETGLSECVDYLKDYHSIEIQIDKRALDDAGVSTDTPITCDYKDMPLKAALTKILKPLDLTWVVMDDVLLITTQDKADRLLTTVVYDVSDLLSEEKNAAAALEKLGELVVATIAPTSWSDVGGPGKIEPFLASNKCALVVAQTETGHAEIFRLLHDLRAMLSRKVQAEDAGPVALLNADPRVDAALKKVVRWDFQETRLQDVLDRIRKEIPIPVTLDEKALEDAGWDLSGEAKKFQQDTTYSLFQPITLTIRDLPLQYALNHLLRKCELIWLAGDGELRITTAEAAENLEMVCYDVSDLFPQGEDDAGPPHDLADSLCGLIAPTTWDPVGGPGSIAPFFLGKLRVLAIHQSQAVHRHCAAFLADLRALKRSKAGTTQPDDALQRVDRNVRAVLDKPIAIHYEAMPLREVITSLAKLLGVNFVLDEVRRDGVIKDSAEGVARKPIDWQQPLRVHLERAPLRRALDAVCKEAKMAWAIRDGAIVVGGKDELQEIFFAQIYDLADMPAFRDKTGRPVPDLDRVGDSIMAAVDKESWECFGGPASCIPIRLGEIQALVVVQTKRNHEAVAEFLVGVRKAAKRLSSQELENLPPLPDKPEVGNASDAEIQDEEPAQDAGPDPLTDTVPWQEAVAGNTAFAVDLYRQLSAREKGNLFFSPWSISTAMAMAYAGARADTAAEMAKTMHYTLPADELHPALAALMAATARDARTHRYAFRTANRLWAQRDWPLLEEFTGVLKKEYGAEAGRVDFAKPKETADEINAWVAKETDGKIPAVVDPEAITPEMRFVLANATLFKAKWEVPFLPNATKELPFHAESGILAARTMLLEAKQRYARIDDLQILEMPYQGKTLSMLILLPAKEPGALDRLEKSLSAEMLQQWTAKLAPRDVLLYLPRFECETSSKLAAVLADMGMSKAFGKADFSGMSADRPLCLNEVLHAAQIKVFERGTIATAATAILGALGGMASEPPKPVILRADHPFLYLIRHMRTGSILFMGRLAEPTRLAEPPQKTQKQPAGMGLF